MAFAREKHFVFFCLFHMKTMAVQLAKQYIPNDYEPEYLRPMGKPVALEPTG